MITQNKRRIAFDLVNWALALKRIPTTTLRLLLPQPVCSCLFKSTTTNPITFRKRPEGLICTEFFYFDLQNHQRYIKSRTDRKSNKTDFCLFVIVWESDRTGGFKLIDPWSSFFIMFTFENPSPIFETPNLWLFNPFASRFIKEIVTGSRSLFQFPRSSSSSGCIVLSANQIPVRRCYSRRLHQSVK